MRRILRISAAALLLLSMILPVSAEETAPRAEPERCTLRADSVSGKPGETVTVPVRIENNAGFTNFGIILDYDRQQLELVSIQLTDERQEPYLCGSCADANIAWESENVSYGYVVCALAEESGEDGVLFTATFRLTEVFGDEASVTPVVAYVRNQSEIPAIFDEVQVQAVPGTVSRNAESTLMAGDANADGYITADDAASAFAASKDASKLTEEQKAAADVSGDGYITADDAARIFAMSKSNQ